MPKHIRLQSDLGRLMPGIVRYTDASGATVYSSHFYQPVKDHVKGHARGASSYTLADSDFEGWTDDNPSAGLHDIENHEALGSEDEDQEGDGYEGHEHEDSHPPGLHDARG
jgi:hypothetical protein